MALKSGDVVGGRFTLKDQLGKGGFGTVWRAEHADLAQDYALKVLNSDIALNEEAHKRFLREVKLATSFVHQYAVQIREFGRDSETGALYFTMDMVAGRSLEQVLQEDGTLSVTRVVRLGIQALQVLEKAHEAGFVHRDLKPANLMLTSGKSGLDEIRVLDFGIAKAITTASDSTGAVTLTGMTIGTLPYMSPEQAQGKKLDARSDLYSVGVILFQLLTGRRPIEADDDAEDSRQSLLFKLVAEPPQELSALAPKCPAALCAAIMTSLQKNASDRHAGAGEFRVALERAAEECGVSAAKLTQGVPMEMPVPKTESSPKASPALAPTVPWKPPRELLDDEQGTITEAAAPLNPTVEVAAPLNPTVETAAPLNPTVEAAVPFSADGETTPMPARLRPATAKTRANPAAAADSPKAEQTPAASTVPASPSGSPGMGLIAALVLLVAVVGAGLSFVGAGDDEPSNVGTSSGVGSDPVPEPGSDPVPEPSSDPVPEPSSDPVPEPGSDPVPEPGSDPVSDTSSDPVPDTSSDPVPDTSSDPVHEPTPVESPDPTPTPPKTPDEPVRDPVPVPDAMTAPDRPAPAAAVLFPYAFSLRTLGGTPLTAAQFQGRVLIVNYWATWSGPSAKVVPHLLALKKRHGDAVIVVGLVLGAPGESSAEQVRSVQIKKGQLGISYPLGLIGDRAEIEKQIPEFKGLPTTLVLDKWGRVRAQKVGPIDEQALERLVAPLLAE